MKANEAPEKIFISYETDEDGYIYTDYMWHRHQFEGVENIEYARTDVFIEKACEWLEPVLKNYAGYYVGEDILGDFRNYMKGE